MYPSVFFVSYFSSTPRGKVNGYLMKNTTVLSIAAVSSLVTIITMTAALLLWGKVSPDTFAVAQNATVTQSPSELPAPQLEPAESAVVRAVRTANPAVVAITISKNIPVYEEYMSNEAIPFEDFFGNNGFFNFNVPQIRQNGTEKREVGGGSGFLVSSDGFIVTNRHVVEDDSAEYAVFTNDEIKYEAKVVARDPVLDLAVLKIEGGNFPHLVFGDSDKLEVGQTVISIGNALAEFRNTVSVGIVSGLSRSIIASDRYGGSASALDHLIQTDAAINQGNSGGPLLNLKGEVIGVNVAVASGAENIGFALSANSVKSIVESVQANGKIVRPFLGIRYIPITKELQKKNNLSFDFGVLVQRGAAPDDLAVMPGSPADKAGIVENDIVLELDGERITTDKNLGSIIRGKEVGSTVTLKLYHRGEEKTVNVTLEEMK